MLRLGVIPDCLKSPLHESQGDYSFVLENKINRPENRFVCKHPFLVSLSYMLLAPAFWYPTEVLRCLPAVLL